MAKRYQEDEPDAGPILKKSRVKKQSETPKLAKKSSPSKMGNNTDLVQSFLSNTK